MQPQASYDASTESDSGADHAIVIGGSMAGLLAARTLADHAGRVTIVERDSFPETPMVRAGVPQARHVHILLQQGQQLLEAMFPGLDVELAEAGAPAMNLTGEFPVLGLGGWAVRYPSRFVARTASRALLEWAIRRRLESFGNVQFVQKHRVTALLADAGCRRVLGVRFSGDDGDGELYGDLVVDASGRSSHAPQWLQQLGYAAPAETTINSFLGYSTRWYEPPAGFGADWKGMLIGSKAPCNPRGGIIFPAEGGRWVVTLSGIARDFPPTDDDGFLAFARSLRSGVLYDAIKEARPLTPVYGYRRTENRLRHFERLTRLPDGFVVLGDAACAFNPVYGQGMTVAAVGAQALDSCLRDRHGRAGLPLRFQKRLARATATAWLMATGEDFRWEATEGGQPGATTRAMHRYMDVVLRLTARSPLAYTTFLEVAQLLKGPAALFKPPLLGIVLAQVAADHLAGGAPRATIVPVEQHASGDRGSTLSDTVP